VLNVWLSELQMWVLPNKDLRFWLTCARHFKPDTFRVAMFHGETRVKQPQDLIDCDVVMTTYATLVADRKVGDILHQLVWYRIILDEGQNVGLGNWRLD
jgi:SNF2 family DNA or RNA helicase